MAEDLTDMANGKVLLWRRAAGTSRELEEAEREGGGAAREKDGPRGCVTMSEAGRDRWSEGDRKSDPERALTALSLRTR